VNSCIFSNEGKFNEITIQPVSVIAFDLIILKTEKAGIA
jgi:hypothetical protein